jgi:regulator of replication initiation timing
LSCQHNYKIPEDTIARNARKLVSVQKQLELFKNDCNKLSDEVTLLRTSNSALRDQLSSVQDNAKLVVSLQEQLDSATSQNSTDQIAASIASFNCQRAEATVQSLQLQLDDKTASENLLRGQCETLSKERDALLGTLNEVRSRFAWDLPVFQPASSDFVSASQRFLADLSGRFFPPGSTPDSRLVRLEVELDELRAANIEYAKELRDLRRRKCNSVQSS